MPFPTGSLVIVNNSGAIDGYLPGSDNAYLVVDSSQTHGLRYSSLPSNTIYVAKNGSDSMGKRNGTPFLTITAALAVAQSGDVVIVSPGTYDETISIPAGVNVRGISSFNTFISKNNVTSNTTLVTLNTNCLLENVKLGLTSSGHYTLRGIVFSSTSAATSKIFNCTLNIDNSGAGVGTSSVVGIYSAGSGVCPAFLNNLENVYVNVISVSSGVKRGILVDTTANTIITKNCSFRSSGGSDSIGAEINVASGVLTIRSAYCDGTTADISQTNGILNIYTTRLNNSNANGKTFTTLDIYPNSLQFSLTGAVTSNATRYMRISDATTANEIKQTIYQQCLLKNIYVRSRIAPGTLITDTFTIRKNGADTALTVSLANTATSASNITNSVTFAANDDISLKLVTGLTSVQADIVVTVEIY